mgnify:CR=1 FL=1
MKDLEYEFYENVKNWDFSMFNFEEEFLTNWNMYEILKQNVTKESKVLDLGTGGGENLLKNYSHIQVTMVLLDRIPSPGQLIMPALTLTINLSFLLLLKLNQSNKQSFSKGGKKSPTIMGWIYIDNTRLQ